MKKLFILLFIGLCFTSSLYAGETLTDKQKEVLLEELGAKIETTDSPVLIIKYCTKALTLVSNFNDAASVYYCRGTAYIGINKIQEAMDDFERAIKITPDDINFFYPNYQKAIENFTKVIELDSTDTHMYLIYLLRFKSYSALGKYQEAKDDYTKAIDLEPENALAYFVHGLTYVGIEESQKAIDDFTRAIELNPKYTLAYSNRGNVYSKLGKNYKLDEESENYEELKKEKENYYRSAIDDYTKAIEIDTTSSDIYKNRGDAYYELGEYWTARNDYTRIIELNPTDAFAYEARGRTYKKGGSQTTACDDFYQAGLLHLKQGYEFFVTSCIREIKESDMSSPLLKKLVAKLCDYYYQEALVFLSKGDRTKALENIDSIKDVDYSSLLIKKLMDKIYEEPKKKK